MHKSLNQFGHAQTRFTFDIQQITGVKAHELVERVVAFRHTSRKFKQPRLKRLYVNLLWHKPFAVKQAVANCGAVFWQNSSNQPDRTFNFVIVSVTVSISKLGKVT